MGSLRGAGVGLGQLGADLLGIAAGGGFLQGPAGGGRERLSGRRAGDLGLGNGIVFGHFGLPFAAARVI